MIESHDPNVVNSWKGLFDRGDIEEVPLDHLSRCNNMKFGVRDLLPRHGSALSITLPNIVRFRTLRLSGQAARYLILNSSGSLFDSTDLVSPILTIPAMTDFAMVVINDIAYISPHDGSKGLAGEEVYLYIGSGTARKAAGAAPSGFTLTAANSATSGNVEAGTKLFAIVWEYNTGFYSEPGPSTVAELDCTGGFKVDLSGIPALPTSVVGYHVVATKTITDYNGDWENQEWYFVPDGDGVDSTISVSFFDAGLVESADYLFENLSEIPAGVFLCTYDDRLVVGGENANPNVIRISKKGEYEVFNEIEGYNVIDLSNTGTVVNGLEYRGQLIVFKQIGVYASSGSATQEPIYWLFPELDMGVGAGCNSIGVMLDNNGATVDKAVVGSLDGVKLFNGTFEEELSWKIHSVWERINKQYFHKVQVDINPLTDEIYCLVPLDDATVPSHVLYANYSMGLDKMNIKWSIWRFPANTPSFALDLDFTTKVTSFKFAQASNIYELDSEETNDFENAITYDVTSAYIPENLLGSELHAGGLRLRVTGSGTLNLIITGLDSTPLWSPPSITLTSAPGYSYFTQLNVQSSKFRVRMYTNVINHYFSLKVLNLFTKEIWKLRPS